MAKKPATELLKERIAALEIKQAEEGKAFREELVATYESLKPVNLLKNTVQEFTSSPELKKALFETIVLLINGFITKAVVSSPKNAVWVKLLTTLLQLGVTSALTNRFDLIYQFFSKLIEKIIPSEGNQKA
jgi:hypothetical protein